MTPLSDPTIQTAIDILGPSGTAVSLATTILLSYRFAAFVLRSVMWFLHRRDLQREGRPSEPPPELPASLGVLLVFMAGSALAMTEPVARVAMAKPRPMIVSEAATDKGPTKKPPPQPPKKGKCGTGCTGEPPNCRCTSKTETSARVMTPSTEKVSMLGDSLAWEIEPLQTGPIAPR